MRATTRAPVAAAGLAVMQSVGGVHPTPPIPFMDRCNREEEAIHDQGPQVRAQFRRI